MESIVILLFCFSTTASTISACVFTTTHYPSTAALWYTVLPSPGNSAASTNSSHFVPNVSINSGNRTLQISAKPLIHTTTLTIQEIKLKYIWTQCLVQNTGQYSTTKVILLLLKQSACVGFLHCLYAGQSRCSQLVKQFRDVAFIDYDGIKNKFFGDLLRWNF